MLLYAAYTAGSAFMQGYLLLGEGGLHKGGLLLPWVGKPGVAVAQRGEDSGGAVKRGLRERMRRVAKGILCVRAGFGKELGGFLRLALREQQLADVDLAPGSAITTFAVEALRMVSAR